VLSVCTVSTGGSGAVSERLGSATSAHGWHHSINSSGQFHYRLLVFIAIISQRFCHIDRSPPVADISTGSFRAVREHWGFAIRPSVASVGCRTQSKRTPMEYQPDDSWNRRVLLTASGQFGCNQSAIGDEWGSATKRNG